jgi:hypothetical protein
MELNFFKSTPVQLADDIIKLHLVNGLTQEQAEKSAVITLQAMLVCGIYPYAHSVVKRAENTLLKRLGLPLSKY